MSKSDINRDIPEADKCELWGRAAGRCQFQGCNRPLFLSDVTQERVNASQKAHIHSFSKQGPRGRGPFAKDTAGLNRVGNLMLLCYQCHREIDKQKDGGRYNADLLKEWKAAHERRISVATAIAPEKKSHIVVYGANVGTGKIDVQSADASLALFPEWYPAREEPIRLNMTWEGRDDMPTYWQMEEANLRKVFDRDILPLIEDGGHFSLFGFAPMPLLIRLGALFSDRVPVEIYQRHREPAPTWRWSTGHPPVPFQLRSPNMLKGQPVLVLSLSANISHERVEEVMGAGCSIWELAVHKPHNDFLKTREQLSAFRASAREILARILEAHGAKVPLAIFPAMPVATSIELGRVRMPKASMPWHIYDHNQAVRGFAKVLEIGG
jgi:hypothetical protein